MDSPYRQELLPYSQHRRSHNRTDSCDGAKNIASPQVVQAVGTWRDAWGLSLQTSAHAPEDCYFTLPLHRPPTPCKFVGDFSYLLLDGLFKYSVSPRGNVSTMGVFCTRKQLRMCYSWCCVQGCVTVGLHVHAEQNPS